MCSPSLKVIWNITKKCGYDCDICATYSDRIELESDGKNKVLSSILSLGEQNIAGIDISGGDPLFATDSIQIIHDAIRILGEKKISVTTTGKGINAALEFGEDLSRLLYNCEITIDCFDHYSDCLRNDSSYITTNRDAIRTIEKNAVNLVINVPVLNTKIDDNNIKKMVDTIAKIDVCNISVNLIRLMNVGRMHMHPYPSAYFPEHFVKTFIECAKNTCIKNVHVQCALRGKILGSQCNMLSNKIGVDYSGNVFACPWGAYLADYDRNNISENPFYVGNLLYEPLSDLLTNKPAALLRQSIRDNPTKHCRVYCFANNSDSIFTDIDPLFSYGD